MTNHELARAAAEKCLSWTHFEDADAIQLMAREIAVTYDAPMAELEKLRRQVKLATEHTGVRYYEMGDYYYCEFCGASHSNIKEVVHEDDCPHNEVAT